MLARMMNRPLLISSLIAHAAKWHGDREIVTKTVEGPIHRYSWAECEVRAKKFSQALARLGVKPGDRIGTLAWNTFRHVEAYYGVAGMGAVTHTINPRLFPEQLEYVVNHADDQYLAIDLTFFDLVGDLLAKTPNVKGVIVLTDRAHMPADVSRLRNVLCYEELLAAEDGDMEWPVFDDESAAALCYTSGTTGNPKGALYGHKSTIVHTLSQIAPDCMGLSARDSVLPVVPMFHVNAWGTPYACAMTGSSMVMPGPDLHGEALVKLIDELGVTVALGVPTIWQGLLAYAAQSGSKMESLERTVIGGSACPPVMIDTFRDQYGVDTVHAWGMTEMSPLGSSNVPLAKHLKLPIEEQRKLRENQGRPPFGVELKIVGDDGEDLPCDGETQGDLVVRGHWVLDSYFRREDEDTLQDGWFNTGDVATLDADGYLTIRDRSKDIIKSGGEWISSVELENIAVAHPKLATAAVIGVPHPKWDERPLLVAVKAEGQEPGEDEILSFFDGKIAKWQTPDRVVFVETLPLGATGKVLKRDLREQFKDVLTG